MPPLRLLSRFAPAPICVTALVVFVAGAVRGDVGGFDPRGFEAAVAPFLQQHCVKCHGPEKQKGKLRLDSLSSDLLAGPDVQIWNDVRAKLLAGEMPPEKEPQPAVPETQRIVDWLTKALKANGKVTLRQPPDFNHPRFGNRVNHEALFHPKAGIVASTPARLWRLSSFGYTEFANGLSSQTRSVIPPFSTGNEPGFNDFAALALIDEPVVHQLMGNAEKLVEFQTTPWQKKGKQPPVRPSPELIALVEGEGRPGVAQIESAIRLQFGLVLQREPTTEELRRFVALMNENFNDAGRQIGARTTLAAVLLLPEALYRTELGGGRPDAHGRLRLTPRELASAISFALTDRRPDSALLQAAEQEKLATREQVAEQVARLLHATEIEKPRLLRFFQEYFGYHLAPEVFKNTNDFKDHVPEVLVRDTDRLIEYVLAEDKNVLYELLTTRKSFVGHEQLKPTRHTTKRAVFRSYNLDKLPAEQPVELPADQRLGVLTQPSWLVAYSGNAENNAILRGKWVRERLLGGTIPDLPITVNAQLPDTPEKTLRERMAVTLDSYCWQCHEKMNPLGLAFEGFDHFGRYRETEEVVDPTSPATPGKKGEPPLPARREVALDTTGAIAGSGDLSLDGDIQSARHMLGKLAGSDRVRQVFVRHAFRYFLGRNETLEDAPTLAAADEAYIQNGGSMKALIVSLLTSDSFLLRKEAGR